MGRPAGQAKTGGRTKGTPNKDTADIRAMIIGALDKVGGIDYLAARAIDTPAAFLTLIGKVLPLQLSGDPDNPITYVLRAPSPVDSAAEWLRQHAPSDSRTEPMLIDAVATTVIDADATTVEEDEPT